LYRHYAVDVVDVLKSVDDKGNCVRHFVCAQFEWNWVAWAFVSLNLKWRSIDAVK